MDIKTKHPKMLEQFQIPNSISMSDFNTNPSKYVEQVSRNDEHLIMTKNKKPLAVLATLWEIGLLYDILRHLPGINEWIDNFYNNENYNKEKSNEFSN